MRSDEGLESKRGTDVTYYTGKYNLALKSKKAVGILILSVLVV